MKTFIYLLTLAISSSCLAVGDETASRIEAFLKKNYILHQADNQDDILGNLAFSYVNREGFIEVKPTARSCLKRGHKPTQMVADNGNRKEIQEFYKVNQSGIMTILQALGFTFSKDRLYMNKLVQQNVRRIDYDDIDWNLFQKERDAMYKDVKYWARDMKAFVIKSSTTMGLISSEIKTKSFSIGSFITSGNGGLGMNSLESSSQTGSVIIITPAELNPIENITDSQYQVDPMDNYDALAAKETKKSLLAYFRMASGEASGQATESAEDILSSTANWGREERSLEKDEIDAIWAKLPGSGADAAFCTIVDTMSEGE